MPTRPATVPHREEIPQIQRIVSVLWPSFLTAAAATIIFFVLFDPQDLAGLLGFNDMSRTAGYTAGFFGFWVLTSVSSALTCYFRRPCHERAELPSEEQDVEQ